MQDIDKKKDRGFTNTEVGTLIEDFRGDIRLLAEGFGAMSKDIRILKEDVGDIKIRLRTVEDAVKIAIPTLDKRVTHLELKAAG